MARKKIKSSPNKFSLVFFFLLHRIFYLVSFEKKMLSLEDSNFGLIFLNTSVIGLSKQNMKDNEILLTGDNVFLSLSSNMK